MLNKVLVFNFMFLMQMFADSLTYYMVVLISGYTNCVEIANAKLEKYLTHPELFYLNIGFQSDCMPFYVRNFLVSNYRRAKHIIFGVT